MKQSVVLYGPEGVEIQRKNVVPWRIGIVVALLMAAPGGLLLISQHRKTTHSGKATDTGVVWTTSSGTFTSGGGFTVTIPIDSQPGKVEKVRDQKTLAAFAGALKEWSQALHRTIRRPELLEGDYCDRGALACSVPAGNQIYLSRSSIGTYDTKTIFMHEIGHILGVPHIEGDSLMNANYTGKVEHPSRFAVLLAKASEKP